MVLIVAVVGRSLEQHSRNQRLLLRIVADLLNLPRCLNLLDLNIQKSIKLLSGSTQIRLANVGDSPSNNKLQCQLLRVVAAMRTIASLVAGKSLQQVCHTPMSSLVALS